VATGKICEKRDRGSKREKLQNSLTKWTGSKTATELISSTRDR
jgi:hypothetical protein